MLSAFVALVLAPLEPVADRFVAEAARINRQREQEKVDKERMAKAMLQKGSDLSKELSTRGERRRMLQLREQELFAQWTSTQRKLELQAKSMMQELGESANYAVDTRAQLEAAKAERVRELREVESVDERRLRLMERRKTLLHERFLIAAELEELSGNMTVLDAAKEKALQSAVLQADVMAQEEQQLKSLESESSKERSELWNLDLRLKSLTSSVNSSIDSSLKLSIDAAAGSDAAAATSPSPSPSPLSAASDSLSAEPLLPARASPVPSPSPSPIPRGAMFAASAAIESTIPRFVMPSPSPAPSPNPTFDPRAATTPASAARKAAAGWRWLKGEPVASLHTAAPLPTRTPLPHAMSTGPSPLPAPPIPVPTRTPPALGGIWTSSERRLTPADILTP